MNAFRIARQAFAAVLIMSLLLALLPAGALASSTGNSTTEVLPLAVSEESGFIASGSCGDGIQWQLSSLGDLVLTGTGAMEDYATASACPWYSHRQSIKTLEFGDGITSVGDRAFYNCEALSQVTLGGDMTTVGTYAFRGCTTLTEITIPASVTQLEASAFRVCTALKTVRMDGPAPTVGNYVFTDCAADPVLSYYDEYSADYGVSPWTGFSHVPMHTGTWVITTPATCTTAGSRYIDCTYCYTTITEEILPQEHRYESGICTSCGKRPPILANGSCGYNVTWCFDALGTLSISGNGYMYDYLHDDQPWSAFCAEITEVIVENGVTSIGKGAFRHCSSLTSITIPESVTSIGGHAFYDCSSLASITIPEGLTSIGDDAFLYCSSLTSITLPEGVTSIGEEAFAGCSSLTSITIPESVTSIGISAFWHCSSLTSITIPEGVTSIGLFAFCGCSSLTSITIPESVTSIGIGAFGGCSSLTSITIPESVTSIEISAFSGCTSLISITIPESVTSIGPEAFYGCTSLTSIAIPESVTSIDQAAFFRCTSLTSIAIPESVTSIGADAFRECSSLTSIAIPEGVTGIGADTFRDCSSLTSITIPESVTRIGDYAFAYCNSLWHILYTGTKAQWNAISIGYSNGNLTNATRHYNAIGNEISSVAPKEPTCTIDGERITSCAVCGDTHTEVVIAQGHKIENGICVVCGYQETAVVAGSITSSGEGEVTLTLTEAGKDQPLNTVTTSGQNYSLDVLPGTYILTVSTPNHVPRQYTLSVSTEPVSLDVKICLIGDINGDGKVNVADTAKAYGHVKGGAQLTDYSFACGDVDGNGKINVVDTSKLYAHAKETKPLW